MTTLKPCPFCGAKAIIGAHDDSGPGAYIIVCQGCMAATRIIFNTKALAHKRLKELWNARTSDWRPIETAPKDGTEIDLLVEDQDDIKTRYTDCWWGLPGSGYFGNRKPLPEQWCQQATDGGDVWTDPVVVQTWTNKVTGKTFTETVTHWMPIPKPPAAP